MEKLYAALRDKHPNAEVRDVKFIVNPSKVDDQDLDALDEGLAEVVREAQPLAGPEALA
ncbi:hypothetical protein JQC91_07240 [Jannaschia sp. Os4]|uniref:hypothetical protein n=1 Tax=Jannaschia sp. Os4 TaxID=2807617 RepID=UPI00193AD51E|nr:hypothetical protein [Jannaschia sp. Os4]MBM2576095.1 hypothetical protein [Jannaschia sp. Os4]